MTTLRTAVLLEGHSDRVALETLARLAHRDLCAEGIELVVMGGITNTGTFASRFGPRGLALTLAGLYDAPDEDKLRRGLALAGLQESVGVDDLTGLGFFKCSADLEDELIRALGVEGVETVIEAAGEAQSLRLLANMPVQRDWPRVAVLRRFFGSQSGRKARYAQLMVEALGVDRAPAPLSGLLARL